MGRLLTLVMQIKIPTRLMAWHGQISFVTVSRVNTEAIRDATNGAAWPDVLRHCVASPL